MGKSSPLMIEIGQGLSLMIGIPTISSWKTSERPKKAKRGTFGFNNETNSLEFWDGSNWYAGILAQI
jgi:hypothetical protein